MTGKRTNVVGSNAGKSPTCQWLEAPLGAPLGTMGASMNGCMSGNNTDVSNANTINSIRTLQWWRQNDFDGGSVSKIIARPAEN